MVNRPQHGGNLIWAATVAGCPPSSIVDFSASINPLGPPVSAVEAIKLHLHTLCSYPDPYYSELRSAIGQHHHIDVDWVLPGNGAAELLTWAAWELAKLDTTLIVTPAFGDYYRSLKTFGARILTRSLVDPQGELGSLDSALQSLPSVIPHSLGLIVNNPHNPTGQIWRRETIIPYLEEFDLVVIDESFMDFLDPTKEQSLISLIADYPNLVILRSLTKFYSLPGLRLGYCIAHPDRLRRWYHWRDPWPVNTLATAAGIAVLKDREFQWQTWEWLPIARLGLAEGLSKLAGLQVYPGAANFLLVRTDRAVTDLQYRLLQHDRLLIRDCLSFPELGDRFFRVAVRTDVDRDRLLSALAEIMITKPVES
jgi:L-threonine-O-3-phosphate decarboxylase